MTKENKQPHISVGFKDQRLKVSKRVLIAMLEDMKPDVITLGGLIDIMASIDKGQDFRFESRNQFNVWLDKWLCLELTHLD